MTSNGFPWRPTRVCLNKSGPGEAIRFAIAIIGVVILFTGYLLGIFMLVKTFMADQKKLKEQKKQVC